ncbi:aspartyl protease family protein [uncultured Alistipes sp.]|uniref:aspartyl protease family protein n=1 Tax=uncultured Alistipes sp. TaxID=538949 RepID=UPI0025D4EFF6|nr:aspartyl protease family protein [uncultured Alistipes sp.]
MKFTSLLASFLLSLTFVCCGSGSVLKEGGPAPEPIPAGAVAFHYNGHLYFDATVCDTIPASLLFDTGATGLYVDSLWLTRSGITSSRTMRARIGGAGADRSTVRVLLDTLDFRIDEINWNSGLTPVLQLKEILGRRVDGIFGQWYLAKNCVEFNLRRGYMRRVSADTLAAAGFVRHPVEKNEDRIYVPARVQFGAECVIEGKFVLDMGSSSAITITSPAARKAGFDTFAGKKVAYSTVAGGIGGKSEALYCRAESVAFGGHRLAGIPVGVSQNRSGFLAKEHVAGLIGNELLERFDFVIDFAEPALWLRPVADFGEPFPFVTSGFTVIDRTDIGEGWPVTGLFEEAYAPAGLQPGDVVVSWDGEPVTKLDRDSIVDARGSHRIVALRDGTKTEYEFETKEIL